MDTQTYSPPVDKTPVLSDRASRRIKIDSPEKTPGPSVGADLCVCPEAAQLPNRGRHTGLPLHCTAPTPSIKEFREPLLKRPLDILISLTMLLMSIPFSLLIAIAIKLEDGGPVFYRQRRWGRFGKKFMVFKFRTMIPDADKKFGLKQAKENDQRITRVGRILRAAGLDELPQILNILRGEMSFVGPRALAVGEIIFDKNGQRVDYEKTPGFHLRQVARPGLTSLATIYIPKDSPAHQKFRYDLYYIRKLSFGLDLQLISLSFWISFRGKWETRQRKV